MIYKPEAVLILNEKIEGLGGQKGVISPKSGKSIFIICDGIRNWVSQKNGVEEGLVTIPDDIKNHLGERKIDYYRLHISTRRNDETILVVQDEKPKPPYYSGKVYDFFSIPYGLVINFKEDGRAIKIRRFGFQQLPQRGIVKIIKTIVFDGALPFDKDSKAVETSLPIGVKELTLLIMEAYKKEQERKKQEKLAMNKNKIPNIPPKEVKKGGLLAFLGI